MQLKSAVEIINIVEPNGELLDNETATQAMEMYAEQVVKADRQQIVEVIENLAEDCPNCGNAGFYVINNRFVGKQEQVQCQWCYETKNSRFNINNLLSQIKPSEG